MFITDMGYSDERSVDPGWYYWVYDTAEGRLEFINWMEANMSGPYQATPRFNNGNPMVEVLITDEVDQAIFKLRWLSK